MTQVTRAKRELETLQAPSAPIADVVAPQAVPVVDLRTRIADSALSAELKVELYDLMENMERAARVLKVYADKRNWRKEWFDNPRGYSWVFTNAGFYFGNQNMLPEELMDRVDRVVNGVTDERFDEKGNLKK